MTVLNIYKLIRRAYIHTIAKPESFSKRWCQSELASFYNMIFSILSIIDVFISQTIKILSECRSGNESIKGKINFTKCIRPVTKILSHERTCIEKIRSRYYMPGFVRVRTESMPQQPDIICQPE